MLKYADADFPIKYLEERYRHFQVYILFSSNCVLPTYDVTTKMKYDVNVKARKNNLRIGKEKSEPDSDMTQILDLSER